MALSEEDRQRMNTLHPDLVTAVQASPAPSRAGKTLKQLRSDRAEWLSDLRHLYVIPGPVPEYVTETERQNFVRDGSTIGFRIYVPTKPNQNGKGSPLVVMFHESGCFMGDSSDEDVKCRMFSRDLGALCVGVDYQLAPEHPFPTGVNDVFDAMKWAAETASPTSEILPANPADSFIVGGASAGGNSAAVVSQRARDEKLMPPLTGQYLCVPAMLDSDVVPEKWKADYRSRWEEVNDPLVQLKPGSCMRRIEALGARPEDPLFSPLLHRNLDGLPPALLQLAGLDPLRDEAFVYERVLREEHQTSTKL